MYLQFVPEDADIPSTPLQTLNRIYAQSIHFFTMQFQCYAIYSLPQTISFPSSFSLKHPPASQQEPDTPSQHSQQHTPYSPTPTSSAPSSPPDSQPPRYSPNPPSPIPLLATID